MVKIKLSRHGHIHSPFYKIVAIEARERREGKPLEELGFFNPKTKELKINKESLASWIKKGAQMTTGVEKITGKQ